MTNEYARTTLVKLTPSVPMLLRVSPLAGFWKTATRKESERQVEGREARRAVVGTHGRPSLFGEPETTQ